MSLLRELLDEEGSDVICKTLLDAAAGTAKRRIDLNRFEVIIDAEKENVEIANILEAAETERMSLSEFRAALEERLSKLV